MVGYREFPELVLSRNNARYLLTRNAGEKELLRKKSFLIDKAKSEEEKGFERERKHLLQRQSTLSEIQTEPPYAEREQFLQRFTPLPYVKFNAGRKILWRSEAENDKWEVQSDIPLFTRQQRKRGILSPNNKLLCSSCVPFSHSGTVQHATAMRKLQASSRSSTSLGCILPPISHPRTTYSQKKRSKKDDNRQKRRNNCK